MEYKQHYVINKIIADSSKTSSPCSSDILNINPNSTQYPRLVSRYQDLIRCYDRLDDSQQRSVQVGINSITRQLTQLLKLANNTNTENPAQAIYLLGIIGRLEREMLNQASPAQASRPRLVC